MRSYPVHCTPSTSGLVTAKNPNAKNTNVKNTNAKNEIDWMMTRDGHHG